jgi:peptidoglycan/LPS O-acetylase OafA/YrhL
LVLFFLKENRKILLLVTGIVYGIILILKFFFIERVNAYGLVFPAMTSDQVLLLGNYFLAGAFLAQLKINNYKYKVDLFVTSCILFLLTLIFNKCTDIQFVVFPIIVVLFGCASTPLINNIGEKFGDLSYGIYIYGFFVQQALMHLHPFGQQQLLIISTCVTVFFAYLSWHYIESKALKLKDRIFSK